MVPRGDRVYVPVVAAACLVAVLAVAGWVALGSASAVAAAVAEQRAVLAGPVVLSFVAVLLVVERRWPAEPRPLLSRGHRQDAAYFLLYVLVVVPLVALIGVGLGQLLDAHLAWARLPALHPAWFAVVVAVVCMDACNWLAHRINHRSSALWRLHAVHHSQDELSILTSFRAHPLVHITFLASSLPMFVLSAGPGVPVTAMTAYICLGSLPHANVTWRLGPVGRMLVSPAYHRLHHAAAGRIDINLGTVFTFWDVLSRRAVFPVRGDAAIATGLPAGTVPSEMAAQLVDPFMRRPRSTVPGRGR